MAGIPSSPMSVKDITAKAVFEWNPFIPLKNWLRTADLLMREARIYEHEENYQQAYLILIRYAILVAEKLPSHPDAKKPENKMSMKTVTSTLPDVIDKLTLLKPGIESRYNSWQAGLARRRESLQTLDSGRNDGRSRSSFDLADSDPAISGNSTTLAAADHGDFAVRMAHKELRRRDAARRATRQAGISEEEEQERRTAGLWDDWESALTRDSHNGQDDDIQRRMADTRRRLDQPHDIRPDFVRKTTVNITRLPSRPAVPPRPITNYKYPSISKPQALRYDDWHQDSRSSFQRDTLPPLPSKDNLYDKDLYDGALPPRPEKQPIYDSSKTPPPSTPSPVELEEPPAFTFRPSAYLENGSPLRTVFLPPTLRDRFLSIAGPNTRANLETCGILCGTLIQNALFISRLVIPEQKSTSDTCETTDEGALFDYCDSEDLMVLGWIHTHPTQTCFMSSRDLHTHCGYQVMMSESIAIVCAPSKTPSWGVFRLTDPPGMQSLLNCRQTGLFHPHAEANVYTDALRPGHVFEATGLEFEVVDLRSGH